MLEYWEVSVTEHNKSFYAYRWAKPTNVSVMGKPRNFPTETILYNLLFLLQKKDDCGTK